MIFFKLSRLWNRFAYRLIRLGRKMIWDYTGSNGYLLKNYPYDKGTEEILCSWR